MPIKIFLLTFLLLNTRRLGAWIIPLDFTSLDTTVYRMQDKFIGYDFLQWKWETFDDPTHGRVNYVGRDEAIAKNLSFVSESKFVMRADAWNMVQPESRGRDSVRVTSDTTYDEAVITLLLSHMPEGCTTWPAFWTVTQAGPWPNGGEVDIIEGVNNNTDNISSLHTSPDCVQSVSRHQSGQTTSTNCDASMNFNTGCGVKYERPNSYGHGFNANGGGLYVMRRSRNSGISIWFWSICDQDAPLELMAPDKLGGYPLELVTSEWRAPDAHFDLSGNCDYSSHFDAHQLIFDLTFCGDWAGNAFAASKCGINTCGDCTCGDFVNKHPEAFQNAYWEIDALHVYTPIM